MIDIDHFKHYNDSFGHLEGDNLLKIFAGILKIQCRQSDLVARYGGEEFVVIIPGVSTSVVCSIAERIRHAIETHPFPHAKNQPLKCISASIGISYMDPNNIGKITSLELLNMADKALYAAKNLGRNKAVLYSNKKNNDGNFEQNDLAVNILENENDTENIINNAHDSIADINHSSIEYDNQSLTQHNNAITSESDLKSSNISTIYDLFDVKDFLKFQSITPINESMNNLIICINDKIYSLLSFGCAYLGMKKSAIIRFDKKHFEVMFKYPKHSPDTDFGFKLPVDYQVASEIKDIYYSRTNANQDSNKLPFDINISNYIAVNLHKENSNDLLMLFFDPNNLDSFNKMSQYYKAFVSQISLWIELELSSIDKLKPIELDHFKDHIIHKPNILFLSDSITKFLEIEKVIGDLGYQVLFVNTTSEVFFQLNKYDIKLVLLDEEMLNLVDKDILCKIRSYKNLVDYVTPVLTIVKHDSKVNIEELFEIGIDDCVVIPNDKSLIKKAFSRSIVRHLAKQTSTRNLTLARNTSSNLANPLQTDQISSATAHDYIKEKCIDTSILSQMELMPEGKEIIAQSIDLFNSNAPILLEKMKLALKNENIDEVIYLAKQLRGSAINIGATSLSSELLKIESSKNTEKITPDIINSIEKSLEEVRDSLEKYKNGLF